MSTPNSLETPETFASFLARKILAVPMKYVKVAALVGALVGGLLVARVVDVAAAATTQEIGLRSYYANAAEWTQIHDSGNNVGYVVVSPNGGARRDGVG
jgi:hypothetical protein